MRASRSEKVGAIEIMPKISGVKTGTIDRIDADGSVWVDYFGNLAGPVKARMTGTMAQALRAAQAATPPPVVLTFEEQDPGRPVIVDIVCERLEETPLVVTLQQDALEAVCVDGRTVTFDAQEQIVLRCGKASITLTRAGKVLIRGAYLSTHASGVHRIKGGSVQIN